MKRVAVVTALLAAALVLCAGPAQRADAQVTTTELQSLGHAVHILNGDLPLAPIEHFARFSARMPDGPRIPTGTRTINCRVTAYFDLFNQEVPTARQKVSLTGAFQLNPGELGTLDFGWNGTQIVVKNNGVNAGTLTPNLAGSDEIYLTLGIDHSIIRLGKGKSLREIWPLGSLTIFKNGQPVETILSPRDPQSGLPVG